VVQILFIFLAPFIGMVIAFIISILIINSMCMEQCSFPHDFEKPNAVVQ
jgi:uncharacterized membrane protein YhaH (DUF805 family)